MARPVPAVTAALVVVSLAVGPAAAAPPGPFETVGMQIRRIADACVGWSFDRPGVYGELLKTRTTVGTVCQCAAEGIAGEGHQIAAARLEELVAAPGFREKLLACARLEVR